MHLFVTAISQFVSVRGHHGSLRFHVTAFCSAACRLKNALSEVIASKISKALMPFSSDPLLIGADHWLQVGMSNSTPGSWEIGQEFYSLDALANAHVHL